MVYAFFVCLIFRYQTIVLVASLAIVLMYHCSVAYTYFCHTAGSGGVHISESYGSVVTKFGKRINFVPLKATPSDSLKTDQNKYRRLNRTLLN